MTLALGHIGSSMFAGVVMVGGSSATMYVPNFAIIFVYSLSVGNNWSAHML